MPSYLQFIESIGDPGKMGVAKAMERYTKLAGRLPTRSVGEMLRHDYAKEVSLGEVGRRLINQPAPDTKPGILSPVSEPLVMLSRKNKTDHRLAKLSPQARVDEIARGSRAIARQMEDDLLNGAGKTGSIDGLLARCSGSQLIVPETNGTLLEIEHIEALVDAVQDQGNGKLLVMNKPCLRQLTRKIRGAAGGATVADITSEIPRFEDVQIVIIGDKLDGTPVLDFDEKTGTANETASILCLAPGNEDVELSGVKLLMATNSIEIIDEGIRDSFHYDALEVAFGLAVYDPSAVARLKGIKKAA
jgi:hypothetical protein